MSSFRVEASIYARHVLAVFVPGRRVRTHDVVPEDLARVGDLKDWSDDDMRLLIDECRRTLDQQQAQFDRVRTTARSSCRSRSPCWSSSDLNSQE